MSISGAEFCPSLSEEGDPVIFWTVFVSGILLILGFVLLVIFYGLYLGQLPLNQGFG